MCKHDSVCAGSGTCVQAGVLCLLIWDFSCCCTVSNSGVSKSAKRAGSVAEDGAKAKERKYQELTRQYEFIPIVLESHGPMCEKANKFIGQLGRQMELRSGEPRSTEFLRQSISIAVQKGNALSVMGTIGEGNPENTLDILLSQI